MDNKQLKLEIQQEYERASKRFQQAQAAAIAAQADAFRAEGALKLLEFMEKQENGSDKP